MPALLPHLSRMPLIESDRTQSSRNLSRLSQRAALAPTHRFQPRRLDGDQVPMRVMEAMLGMVKLDIARLKQAHDRR